jgi:hypothetical protein
MWGWTTPPCPSSLIKIPPHGTCGGKGVSKNNTGRKRFTGRLGLGVPWGDPATRVIFKDSIVTSIEHTDQHVIIRLPPFTDGNRKGTLLSTSFNILKQAIDPIREDFKHYLLASLNDKLNSLFPGNLVKDFVCDR